MQKVTHKLINFNIMKIGIVTIHRSKNYGAELQAYAMLSFLQQQGYDASIVDYWPKYRENTEKLFSIDQLKATSTIKALQLIVSAPLVYRRFLKRWKSTHAFVKTYFNLTNNENYDVVIYGSDQIWRKMNYPLFKGYDTVFFGSDYIVAKKRISYAASMGKVSFANNEDETQFLSLLNNFDSISVRESDLKNYLIDKFRIDIPTVCDPVFLLDKDKWMTFVDKSVIPNYPYIFYYNHQEISITTSFTNYLEKKMHIPIIEMRGQIPPFHYSKRYRLTADAREFVSLLSGAAVVVTSSFHGVALSICLEKQFYYSSRQRRANRIESLLEQLDLRERIIDSDFYNSFTKHQIDYQRVNVIKDSFVQQSKDWLLLQLQ